MGDKEETLSLWPSKAAIERWRLDGAHRCAQVLGRRDWYETFEIEVLELASENALPEWCKALDKKAPSVLKSP